MSDVSLVFSLLAKDAASAVIDKVGGKLSGVGKAMITAGAAIAGAAVAGGKALLDLGSEFDDAFDKIRVGTGKTGAALDGLKDDFRAVVGSVPTDFASAGDAIAELAQRTGLAGPPLQDLAKRMLELSRLTGTDLSANIANITRVFGDWSIATAKQGPAMDAIFRASQATGASVTDLTEKVVQFGAPLRQLGFGFEQSLALLGKFEKEGVNTEIVLGAMRKGLAKFAKAGEDPATALQKVIKEIKGAGTAAKANKVALEVFGAKAGPDMAAAIREGRFELGSLFQTVKDGSETIMGASSDTQDFAEKWQMFKNNVLLALEPVASRVFDMLGQVGTKLEPAFATASAFIQSTFIPAVRDIASWLADHFGPAASAVATLVKHLAVEGFGALVGVVKKLQPVLETIGKVLTDAVVPAFTDTVKWIDENRKTIEIVAAIITTIFIPGWIALGVAATIAAVKTGIAFLVMRVQSIIAAALFSLQVLVYVGGWAIMAAAAMINAIKMAAAWIVALGPVGIIIAVIVGLVALVIMNWQTIKDITTTVWNAIWKFVSDILTAIGAFVRQKVDEIHEIWNTLSALPGKFGAWLADTLAAVGRKVGEIVQWFRDLPGKILGALGDLGSLLVHAGEDIIMGLLRGIGSFAHKIWDKIKEIARSAWDAITSVFQIFSPSRKMQWLGQMIGAGLINGLDSMAGPVTDAADRMAQGATVQVPAPAMALAGASTFRGGAGGSGGAAVIEVRSGGSKLDDVLVEVLKAAIRKRGGDPGVLGR